MPLKKPATPAPGPSIVTEAQFRQLCEHLYRATGLIYSEAKRYYVIRRLADRMAATQTTSFAEYFALLHGAELEPFINAFTVNETYFYREDYQLRCLAKDLLPRRLAAKRPGESLRIASVPCSSGEEPYSIALYLLENWPEVDARDVEILGADIDTRMLEAARAGGYGARALMRLDAPLIAKYFVAEGERWRIIEDIRGSVAFSQINAVDAGEVRGLGRFDVIFCRNMLIYFDEASRRATAENLFEALLPGGYLCLGHAESMSRISNRFEICRYDDAIVYRRPVAT